MGSGEGTSFFGKFGFPERKPPNFLQKFAVRRAKERKQILINSVGGKEKEKKNAELSLTLFATDLLSRTILPEASKFNFSRSGNFDLDSSRNFVLLPMLTSGELHQRG